MKKFREWLQWNFGFGGDWNTITFLKTLGVLLFIIGIFCFIEIPGYLRDTNIEGLNEKTSGIIYKIEPKNTLIQGSRGGKFITIGYNIYFEYTVNDIKYRSRDYLSNSNKYMKIISFINNHIGEEKIVIRYSTSDPQNGKISVNETIKRYSKN